MSTIEIVLIIAGVVGVVSLVYTLFFQKKKKGKAKEKAPEPEKQEPSETEKKEKTPFKIIRKKSNVKIHKKALTSGSRNPSVTKVFVNRKMVEEQKEEPIEEVSQKRDFDDHEENAEVNEIMKKPSAYDIRDPEFDSVVSDDETFQFIPGSGKRSRAPRISDRTKFTERINVSEDNNFSGIKGVGIQEIIDKTEQKSKDMHGRTDKMLSDVQKHINKQGGITYDNALADLMREFDMELPSSPQQRAKKTNTIAGLDPKTLIIAEAISTPKYKNKK